MQAVCKAADLAFAFVDCNRLRFSMRPAPPRAWCAATASASSVSCSCKLLHSL